MKFHRFTILLACAIILGACASTGTIAPKPVQSESIAYDGNKRTAGIDGADKDGFDVSAFWISQYELRIAKWGDQLSPPVTDPAKGIKKIKEGAWKADSAAMDANLQAALLEKNPEAKPTPGWEKLFKKITQ